MRYWTPFLFGALLFVLVASAPSFAQSSGSTECGAESSDTGSPEKGTLSFDDGKVKIDFGTDNEPQKISATFNVANSYSRTLLESVLRPSRSRADAIFRPLRGLQVRILIYLSTLIYKRPATH